MAYGESFTERSLWKTIDRRTLPIEEAMRILDLMPDAVLLLNTGIILGANAQAQKLLECKAAELPGRAVQELIPDWVANTAGNGLSGQNESLSYCLTASRTDGRRLSVQITLSPFESPDGPLTMAILRDLSELKSLEEELKEVSRAWEEQQKEQILQDLIYTLEHEVQCPLVGTNLVLDQLAGGEFGKLPDEPAQVLSKVRDSNSALIAFIKDLVAEYRDGPDGLGLSLEECDVCGLLSRCVDECRSAATSRNLRFEVHADCSSALVLADARLLRRVLRKLAGNAIKFSPKGEVITFSISLNAAQVLVTIKNFGRTIAPEDRALLFKQFWRGSRPGRHVAGSEIRLYLCHKIIMAHGGTIACTSEDDAGTTFSVSLPICNVPSAGAQT